MVTRVRFQSEHDVDDLLVTVRDPAGVEHEVAVGIRRDPTIAAGDEKFVALLGDFLSLFIAERARFDAGALTASLVVAAPHPGATELEVLTDLARSSTTAAEFDELVAGRNRGVRDRLGYFVDAVEKVASSDGVVADAIAATDRSDFVWSFLLELHVDVVDVERDGARDRENAIDRLADLTEGDLGRATALWGELCEVVMRRNPAGATLDEASLRRELETPVGPGRRYAYLRPVLDALERSARTRVHESLHGWGGDGEPVELHLPRADERERLAAAIDAMPDAHLVVTGSAAVGKSVLSHAVVDGLREAGAFVHIVHADDVAGLGTASDPFGGDLEDLLATATTSPRRWLLVDGAEAGILDDRLLHLIRAAAGAGYRCLVVTRDDVSDEVTAEVRRAVGAAAPLGTHRVDGLSPGEMGQVVTTFPGLAIAAARSRATDLLQRPGLVEVLLRSEFGSTGGAASPSPAAPITELEVYGRYTNTVIGVSRARSAAASRMDVTTEVARRGLMSAPPRRSLDGEAVDSLRSDGILAPASPSRRRSRSPATSTATTPSPRCSCRTDFASCPTPTSRVTRCEPPDWPCRRS